MPQKQCLIILNPDLEPLAEVWFEGQDFSHVILGRDGESELGPWVEEWQTHGLESPKMVDGIHGSERLTFRSTAFADALRLWLHAHGYVSLTLPEEVIPSWQLLRQAEYTPQERFELAVLLRDLSPEERVRWESSFNEIVSKMNGGKKKQVKTRTKVTRRVSRSAIKTTKKKR